MICQRCWGIIRAGKKHEGVSASHSGDPAIFSPLTAAGAGARSGQSQTHITIIPLEREGGQPILPIGYSYRTIPPTNFHRGSLHHPYSQLAPIPASKISSPNPHPLRTIRLAVPLRLQVSEPKMTVHEDGGGEWNQVSRKRGRLRHTPAPASAPAQLKKELDKSTPTATGAATAEPVAGVRPNPTPEYTVEDILGYHNVVRQEWENSECWRALSDTLTQVLSSHHRPVITKAICLGPGPYEPSNGSAAARKTAHMQTAAFCSIVSKLG